MLFLLVHFPEPRGFFLKLPRSYGQENYIFTYLLYVNIPQSQNYLPHFVPHPPPSLYLLQQLGTMVNVKGWFAMLCNVWISGEEKSCCDLTTKPQGDSCPSQKIAVKCVHIWQTEVLCCLYFMRFIKVKTIIYERKNQHTVCPQIYL